MQKGFMIVELLVVLIVFVLFVCWPINAYKLTQCDFSTGEGKNLRCEAVHGIGLIPLASPLTVWIGTDN